MFSADDEDGDFLSPTGGAKLASLFGLDQATNQQPGNESFQYTAPKQPRKNSNPATPAQKPTPPPGAPAVILATAVHAFKYLNGQYAKQGKLGAAVLGNHTTKEYKLLLYASQQKQVTAARIHVGFVFTVQPSNYCTFYDDQRQNWSLMFDTEKAATDFCKEVCLAKVNSASSLDAVVVQDLCLGEGQGVENGDSLEVAYTGWLLQNYAIGQMFDSNLNKDKLLRLKLGAGKVIKGWEEGMHGMRKAGRRLMVIPPSQGYGSQGVANRVPGDSTLIFEAELRRVKFAKDSASDRTSAGSRDSAAPSPAPSPAPSMENLDPDPSSQTLAVGPERPGEPPLRSKSNSLSEQLTSPDATKAKLISRMAKMGQAMLPFQTGAAASQQDSDDSEMEDPSASRVKENLAAPSPVQLSSAPPSSAHVGMPTATSQMPVSAHAFQPYPYTQTSGASSQLQSVGQMYQAQTVPYMGTGDVTSFLMTEARQHNTEIRLAVGKVADKMEQLSSKMEELQRQGGNSMALPGMSMETSMIMQSIQRIIQENECLKKEMYEKSARIEEQNRKIGELINQNQRYMEQSNLLLEQRNDSLKSSSDHNQARVLQAEQDKVRLTEELASSIARVSQLQEEATSQQQRASELQGKLTSALQDSETHSTHISFLESQLEELKETAERAQAQYRTEKQKRREMELKVNNMEEELQDLKTDKESLERTLADRKRKFQAERQRCDEDMEELRRSSQQETDNLRAQLRKARTSSNQAGSEQLAQLQAELEEEWKRKCEQALASAKEQQGREMAELMEQRDTLEQRLAQLQEKFAAIKQSRDSEEQHLLQQQKQSEELQALQQKYAALDEHSTAVRQKLSERVADLERRLEEQGQGDTAGEVKRVMNGVFHTLRGEFDLHESYTGSTVLGVIVNTIKNVTLQLLNGTETPSNQNKEDKEDRAQEKNGQELQREDESSQVVHVNGKKEEVEEDQKQRMGPTHPPHPPGQPREIQEEERKLQEEKRKPQEEERKPQEEERKLGHYSPENTQPVPVNTHSEPQPVPVDTHSEPREEQVPNTQLEPFKEPHLLTDIALQHQQENTTECSEVAGGKLGGNGPSESEKKTQSEGEGPNGAQDTDQLTVNEECTGRESLAVTNLKTTGPPTQPPPPPNTLVDSPGKVVTSLAEGVGEENGEEPFFQSSAPTKPPPPPTQEDEEDELSLKGCPPPAPLFGDDDEEDDDLDWLG